MSEIRDPAPAPPAEGGAGSPSDERPDAAQAPIDDGPLAKIPTGRLGRSWRVARILNEGAGLGRVRRKAKAVLNRGREGIQAELNRELGENLARSMGEMKGLVMKAGQMLSYLDHQLPGPMREALTRLQTRVKPVDTAQMRLVFEEAMGQTLEETFAEFDEEPIAAASVGQVYRARAPDGRDVAVKIQYPEIVTAVESDLRNVGLMSQLGRALNASVEDVVSELREALEDELNYEQEARNLLAFRAIYQGDPLIDIPALVPEASCRRVLTTTFVEGRSFQQMLETATPKERFYVAKAMGRFFYVAFYFYGMFNADPHPGNYLFVPEGDHGKTVFLDYGCVRRFDRPFLDQQIDFTEVMRTGDVQAVRDFSIEMGIVPRENRDKVDWALLERFWHLTYKPIIVPEPFRYTPEHNRAVSKAMFEMSKKMAHLIRMPKQFVFLNRINFGLNALYAQLGLTINYYDPCSEMLRFYQQRMRGAPIPDPFVERIPYLDLEISYPEPLAT